MSLKSLVEVNVSLPPARALLPAHTPNECAWTAEEYRRVMARLKFRGMFRELVTGWVDTVQPWFTYVGVPTGTFNCVQFPRSALGRSAAVFAIPIEDRSNSALKGPLFHADLLPSPFPGERQAAIAIRKVLVQLLLHELDEQIFLDGARVFDPHSPSALTDPVEPFDTMRHIESLREP